jgi:transposase
MNATTAAVDLAKNVFQVALADANARVLEQHRLTRAQFERFFDNRTVARVVMEACGSAHHWARVFTARGIEVILLPAHYVRAYVRRSKTDAADALALLEAARCADIVAVRLKSVEQQSLQALHRTRSLWMGTRTSRINALRGCCRELGLHVPMGARTGLEAMGRAVADDQSVIPALLRPVMQQLLDEIRVLEARVAQLERQLAQLARSRLPARC